jgi:hypothetical protein
MKNTPGIALVGCEQPLGVILGPERHHLKADSYLKMPPEGACYILACNAIFVRVLLSKQIADNNAQDNAKPKSR